MRKKRIARDSSRTANRGDWKGTNGGEESLSSNPKLAIIQQSAAKRTKHTLWAIFLLLLRQDECIQKVEGGLHPAVRRCQFKQLLEISWTHVIKKIYIRNYPDGMAKWSFNLPEYRYMKL